MTLKDKIFNKQLLKKWWFWVIVVLFVGVIALSNNSTETEKSADKSNQTQSADKSDMTQSTTEKTEEKSTEANFENRFNSLCATLTNAYAKIDAQTACQNNTIWQSNNKKNPEVFPYEYRDINIDFNGQIAYEIKVIKDSSTMEYFNGEYTCENIYGGEASCVVAQSGQDIIYSIIFTDKKDDTEAIKLSDGLRTILDKIK